MREFTEADREKKKRRIQLPENPGQLSPEALSRLEEAVRAKAKDGLVPCPTAWRIAGEQGVSRLDVGVRIDRLGLRVSDCQLGCFQVGKTSRLGTAPEPADPELARRVGALYEKGELTCANVFALAGELGAAPRAAADAANARGHKLRQCQLGCF
ncbi:MAG: hypothetical protein AB1578_00605 [Thermodesulfobacteriota bacterium]